MALLALLVIWPTTVVDSLGHALKKLPMLIGSGLHQPSNE
jgi:hypothetical protein